MEEGVRPAVVPPAVPRSMGSRGGYGRRAVPLPLETGCGGPFHERERPGRVEVNGPAPEPQQWADPFIPQRLRVRPAAMFTQ